MKQIRLKDRIIYVTGCNKCPFWVWVASYCSVNGPCFYPNDNCPYNCPLEEALE
jgi:hypothetical protein